MPSRAAKVTVLYDPHDLTEVHVYHEGRFVCRALSPEHLPLHHYATFSGRVATPRGATWTNLSS